MIVNQVGAGAAVGSARAAARPGGGTFAVRGESRVAGAPPAVELGGLLALQEDGEPVGDRLARRKGERLLAGLGAVQRALLGDGDVADTAGALEGLASEPAVAASAGLRSVLEAVVLRARVQREIMR